MINFDLVFYYKLLLLRDVIWISKGTYSCWLYYSITYNVISIMFSSPLNRPSVLNDEDECDFSNVKLHPMFIPGTGDKTRVCMISLWEKGAFTPQSFCDVLSESSNDIGDLALFEALPCSV